MHVQKHFHTREAHRQRCSKGSDAGSDLVIDQFFFQLHSEVVVVAAVLVPDDSDVELFYFEQGLLIADGSAGDDVYIRLPEAIAGQVAEEHVR